MCTVGKALLIINRTLFEAIRMTQSCLPSLSDMQVSAESTRNPPDDSKGLLAGVREDAGFAQRKGWERVRLLVS